MHKIVIASGNEGKVRELYKGLGELDVKLVSCKEYGCVIPPETGQCFIENAIIKARAIAQETGLPTLADDSGLVVPALKGDPGVYSSRYAGEACNDRANINKLLEAMDGIKLRQAFFYCVLVYMRSAADPIPLIAEGRWQGHIYHESCGDNGFGYDPIFHVEAEDCTAAELDPDKKLSISHRALALGKLKTHLQNELSCD